MAKASATGAKSPKSARRAPRVKLTGTERRASILVAAREVFVESGFAAARTEDIAARAGVNQALLYQHFASKDAMFEAAVVQPIEDALRATLPLAQPIDSGDDPGLIDERFEAFLTTFVELMSDLSPLLGLTLFGGDERSRAFYVERFLPVIDQLISVVAQNILNWDSPEYTYRGHDARFVVVATIGMSLMVSVDRHLMGDAPLESKAIAHELADLLMRGVTARK
jgi:AcrR family transcriptional regulator